MRRFTVPSLEALAADQVSARKLFGPRGPQIVALLAMVKSDSPREQFESAGMRWNRAWSRRGGAHHQASLAIWAGALSGGMRRSWLLNIDRYVDARPHNGPWADTHAKVLLADAAGGEAARGWIGDEATDLLVRDWFYAWLGAG
jgi:hypothetical protein